MQHHGCSTGSSDDRRARRQPGALPGIERLEDRQLLSSSAALPRPDHVVVVVEEDHAYDQILGASVPARQTWSAVLPSPLAQDPYIRQLASLSASMTQMTSVGHPNAITYQALFSGMKPRPDYIPPNGYNAPNIASELISAGMTFGGYSESLPRVGYTGGDVGGLYARQHNPWVDFNNVPAADNMPFSKFPANYRNLPTVSYVIPNADDNMHSGWVSSADQWLQQNISGYASWAMKHNSLLVVTWDESHESSDQIPTLFFGPMVQSGNYDEPVTQANLLATLEEMYGLAPTGRSAGAAPITDVFTDHGLGESVADAGTAANPHTLGSASIQGSIDLTSTAVGGDAFANGKARPDGWWVYLDTNNDGQFEPGEPLQLTYRQHFRFKHLPAGNYVVRVVPQNGYNISSNGAAGVSVSLAKDSHISHIRFSEQPIA